MQTKKQLNRMESTCLFRKSAKYCEPEFCSPKKGGNQGSKAGPRKCLLYYASKLGGVFHAIRGFGEFRQKGPRRSCQAALPYVNFKRAVLVNENGLGPDVAFLACKTFHFFDRLLRAKNSSRVGNRWSSA
jgi:hypothetical protein